MKSLLDLKEPIKNYLADFSAKGNPNDLKMIQQ